VYKSLFAVEFTKSTIVTAEVPDLVQNSNCAEFTPLPTNERNILPSSLHRLSWLLVVRNLKGLADG
jgi:hypothetical protein